MNQESEKWIIAKAQELGFDVCGIVRAEDCVESSHREEWLARGYAGEMRYLHDARRAEIFSVLPEARSVIVCAINYSAAQPYSTDAAAQAATGESRAWISRYAWGDDYHAVIGEKLENLVAAMRKHFGGFSTRSYVDTGPISERVVAQKAGLGWLAKNTCLINSDIGSWLFLGVILTSLELAPSEKTERSVQQSEHQESAVIPPTDLCGNCSLCLDACPTGALVEPYVMDARRCISYLTIELRGSIPQEFRAVMGRQVFGCDICQDVCPWNRSAPHTAECRFAPRENLVAPELEWLLSLTEEDFRRVFKNSAIRRTKWRGLVRNACIAAGNVLARGKRAFHNARLEHTSHQSAHASSHETTRLQVRLKDLAASTDAVIAEHAQWALAQSARETRPSSAEPQSPTGIARLSR